MPEALQALGADVDIVVEFEINRRDDRRVRDLLGNPPLDLLDGVPVFAGRLVQDREPSELHQVKGQVGLVQVVAARGDERRKNLGDKPSSWPRWPRPRPDTKADP